MDVNADEYKCRRALLFNGQDLPLIAQNVRGGFNPLKPRPCSYSRSETDIRLTRSRAKTVDNSIYAHFLSLIVLRSAYYGPVLTQDGHLNE